MKALVVYYSLSGKTEFIANVIASELNADVERIRLVSEYKPVDMKKIRLKDLIQLFSMILGASLNKTPPIRAMKYSLKDYDYVFVGTPVWAGRSAPPVNTFISQSRFNGKVVMLFASCDDEVSGDNALKLVKNEVMSKGGIVMHTKAVKLTDIKSEKVVESIRSLAHL